MRLSGFIFSLFLFIYTLILRFELAIYNCYKSAFKLLKACTYEIIFYTIYTVSSAWYILSHLPFTLFLKNLFLGLVFLWIESNCNDHRLHLIVQGCNRVMVIQMGFKMIMQICDSSQLIWLKTLWVCLTQGLGHVATHRQPPHLQLGHPSSRQ